MKIVPIHAFQDNYIWMIINQDKTCICVDPGDATPVIHYCQANQLDLKAVLVTHHHFDHIGGLAALLTTYPELTVYGPIDQRIDQVHKRLKENDLCEILGLSFQIIEIPGHTSTHIAYYEPNELILFCGDTLFSAGCGRVFDGSLEALYQSLKKISTLPLQTQIYCAHEYTLNNCLFAQQVDPENSALIDKITQLKRQPEQCSLPTTLKNEFMFNPFLRAINQQLMLDSDLDMSPFETFKKIRQMKDNF